MDPKWPNGTDKDSLSKTVRETIHYVYEDGSKAAEDVFDSAHFAHEIIIDRVTGEIVKDNGWTNVDKDYFSQKDSPVIDGYTASKKQVNKIEGLTQDSKDVEETIIYTKNSDKPENPDKPEKDTTPMDDIKDAVEDVFPNTGTDVKAYLSVLGAAILAITSILFFKKRK